MRVLQAPRHACTGCGSCCQGAIVHLIGDEPARVARFAERLGLPDPVVDGALRRVDGACVFLAADQRCRIHAEFGGTEKPSVCRQFPFVTLDTESGPRAGIDPASPGWWWSRNDGPAVIPEAAWASPRPSHLAPDQVRVEAALVGACSRDDASIASLLAISCGTDPTREDLPPGFAGRWVTTVRVAPLRRLMARPEVGPSHRAWLGAVLDAADGWDPARPPAWPALARADEVSAILMLREMLFLRLCSRIPLVQATALLLLGGAVACAWADPAPATFAVRYSTWCRMLRAGPFWQALVPSPAALQALAGT